MTQWVIDVVVSGGYWGVFALMVLENLFPPLPSELFMPLAGYACADGRLQLAPTVAAGTLGSVVGALPWFWGARWLGRARIEAIIDRAGPWLGLERQDLARADAWFTRAGAFAVLVGRLVPGVRTLISAPAGLFAMPTLLFLLLTSLGSLAWVSVLTGAGYVLEAHYHRVVAWIDPVALGVLSLAAFVYVWRVSVFLRRQARHNPSAPSDHSH